MRRHAPEINTVSDSRVTPAEKRDETFEIVGEILFERFRQAQWNQRGDQPEGKLIKTAMITLSRSTLGQQAESAGIHAGVWPTVRNTKFFADRLQRVKVDFHHFQIPNDGAMVSGANVAFEGDELGEQTDLDLEQQAVYIRTISAFKEVTDESLDDFGPGFRAMFTRSLLQAVAMRIDAQIIAGSGTAPNILGVRNWPSIGSQSKSTDSVLVAISKAAEKVYEGGYSPDLILMHPADWQAAVTSTSDSVQLLDHLEKKMDVLITEASPSGLPTVMDTSAVYFLERSPVTLTMTKYNTDDFLMNISTVKAYQRVAVAITDVAAVCKVVA